MTIDVAAGKALMNKFFNGAYALIKSMALTTISGRVNTLL